MNPLITLSVLLAFTFMLIRRLHKEKVTEMELAEALSVVLDKGIAVSLKNWHLWQGAKSEYVLLQFDNKSNPLDSTEERFPATADGRSDAVSKFVQKTKNGA